ncbi:30435_t:CDS:2, partial [Racocetra persica]
MSCNLHQFIQFFVKLYDKESLKLILIPKNTICWYEQGAKDIWTSKIADKLLEQANSGFKSTEQFLNLSENVEYIKRQKKEEDMHSRFCDNIKVKLNHPLKSWYAIKYLIPLHTYLQAKKGFDVLFNFNFKFDPPKRVESWIDNIWDNEIEEITQPDLRGADEHFFKNSFEELL